MASTHDQPLDGTKPALILLFGNTCKKHRLLDRDVIVIGRARGCDLGLDAPDVSSVHCIISRGPGGFHMRDCQSRAGTKHNGNSVREATLRDGDLLQIGSFSFRVDLPSARLAPAAEQEPAGGHEKPDQDTAALQTRMRQLEKDLSQLQHRYRDAEAAIKTERLEINRQQQAIQQQQLAFKREYEEFAMTRDQWAQDHDAILARLGDQKKALAEVEETLRLQRQGLDDLVVTLQETRPPVQVVDEEELQKLRADNDELHAMLKALESERQRTEATTAAAQSDLTEELAALRNALAEKEAALEEIRNQTPAVVQPPRDIDTYEAELNVFQRQLESDRTRLNTEIEQMRARNKELDEATREMELEMSRERADLARERQRLDRLREDVRLELDRMQREGGLRDRLAPLQGLRDSINRRPPANDQTPKAAQEDPINGRLRALRNKVNE